MTEYLGVIAFLLALMHYLYQSILLPSSRQKARDELFCLRDELRAGMLQNQDNYDKKTMRAFKEVDDALSRAINRLHLLTFTNFVKATLSLKEIEQDKAYQPFHRRIENAESELPLNIYTRSGAVLNKVLFINSFMFMVYLIPLVILIKCISSVYLKIKQGSEFLLDTCLLGSPRNNGITVRL